MDCHMGQSIIAAAPALLVMVVSSVSLLSAMNTQDSHGGSHQLYHTSTHIRPSSQNPSVKMRRTMETSESPKLSNILPKNRQKQMQKPPKKKR